MVNTASLPNFTHSELFTNRRQRVFIPESRKDNNYWDRRRRNNAAAKRSREKRRINDIMLESKVMELRSENEYLRSQLKAIFRTYGIRGEDMTLEDNTIERKPKFMEESPEMTFNDSESSSTDNMFRIRPDRDLFYQGSEKDDEDIQEDDEVRDRGEEQQQRRRSSSQMMTTNDCFEVLNLSTRTQSPNSNSSEEEGSFNSAGESRRSYSSSFSDNGSLNNDDYNSSSQTSNHLPLPALLPYKMRFKQHPSSTNLEEN